MTPDPDALRSALDRALGRTLTEPLHEKYAPLIRALFDEEIAALAGSDPAAGLREVLANLDREVEAYARLEAEDAARKEWALADRWRYMASGVAQAVEAVRQYVPALAATPTASPTATGERDA